MSIILDITGRNLRLYFRDRLGVFFSLLAAIILFLLYTLFLGNLQTQGLESAFPDAPDGAVKSFVDSWMFAGIVGITAVTTGLGAFSTFVEDGASGRFRDFLVSPISRGQLVLGYLLSSFVIGSGNSGLGWGAVIGIPSFVLMIAICALELLVCVIQAYVFALLTSLYINDAVNLH